MSKVTAVCMDTITKKSGHKMVPCAVSVCTTPAAPSPLPIPYPVVANINEGVTDPPMRTKLGGAEICTVGSSFKKCHGNEPGTLKEVVSLNTGGPSFVILGAPNVFIELGMAGITGSPGMLNKAITVGIGGRAAGAGGAGGGGGGASGDSASSGGPGGPAAPAGGGGGEGSGSHSGAGPGTSSSPADKHTCQNGHPVDVVSGCVVDQAVDVELPGVIPLVWKRYYSSARRNDRDASLGPGWAHGFEQRITRARNLLHLRDGEGRMLTFEHVGEGSSTFHRRERMWLHGTASGYRVERLEDRRVLCFERFEADGPAWLTRIADRYGNAIELHYDGGRLQQLVDTAGRRVEVSWKGRRIEELRVIARKRAAQTIRYRYSAAGCLIAAIDASGHAEQYEYDDKRRMSAAVIKTGVRFQYAYDEASGRCARTWGPKGLYRLQLEYDTTQQRTVASGEEPRIYDWNDLGLMTREATPDGTVLTERAYDEDGYLVAEVDGAGDGTHYWYDELGNLARVVDAADRETRFAYAHGRPIERTTPDGLSSRYTYDDAGELIGMALPSGAVFRIERDQRGRGLAVHGPAGELARYEYDGQHNVVAEWDARGQRTLYSYDELGRPVRRVDALGREIRQHYDAMGRCIACHNPDGTTTRYSYDALGNVTERIDRLGQRWSYRYGGMGVLTGLTEPDGRNWQLTHTAFERLQSVTNPKGECYAFEYDQAGRVVAETSFDERVQRYSYDRAGELARIDYDDGSHRAFTYDSTHQLIEERASDGSLARYNRNQLGRLVSAMRKEGGESIAVAFQHDKLGRVVAERQDRQVLRFEYDELARRTSRALPNGTVTHYEYDAEDDLSAIEHSVPRAKAHRLDIERDEHGRATRIYASAGEQQRFNVALRYDAMDRLLEQRVHAVSPSQELREASVLRRFAYDRADRAARIEDKRWGSTEIAYDHADRLLSYVSGHHREAFEYDGAGYIERALRQLDAEGAAVTDGAAPATEPSRWQLGPGNRLLSTPEATYAYDARGRLVSKTDPSGETRYRWNDRDQLRAVRAPDGRRVTFRYDAFGRRMRKDVTGPDGATTSTRFLWDGTEVCADIAHGALRSFVHHPNTGVPLLQGEHGEVFTYVCDQVGVPKELIDQAGMVAWAGRHAAWGELIQSAADPESRNQRGRDVTTPFRLLGQYHDAEIGLACTLHRYFDASTARWLSPDPLRLTAGPNHYSFNSAPTVVVDPLGLADGSPHGSAEARAKELHGAMDPRGQRQRTIAVTNTKEGVRVISTSENDRGLRKPLPGMLKDGEIEAPVTHGHAEVAGVKGARELGYTPVSTAASRPICDDCAAFLADEGVQPASPLKNP